MIFLHHYLSYNFCSSLSVFIFFKPKLKKYLNNILFSHRDVIKATISNFIERDNGLSKSKSSKSAAGVFFLQFAKRSQFPDGGGGRWWWWWVVSAGRWRISDRKVFFYFSLASLASFPDTVSPRASSNSFL